MDEKYKEVAFKKSWLVLHELPPLSLPPFSAVVNPQLKKNNVGIIKTTVNRVQPCVSGHF